LKIRLPKDDPGNRIMPEVAPLPSEIVLYKITGSAFNSTPLHLILHNMGRRTLILCGLITNGCVESTARDARDLSYDLIVASDACAGYA
jgi:nicotinamidase-related amidase